MADQEAVKALVRGAYDMHVHSGPDVLPRRFDDVALAEHALEVGLKGFVLKSHYVGTADRASLLRRVYPGLEAHGGLVLNNSVGGLNPLAVDIAGRLGTRVVWLPTVDAANELSNIAGQQDESKLPYWMTVARELRSRGIAGEGLRVTDDGGAVTGPAMQCLELIAHYDMVLATGHVSPAEMLAVVRAAREAKVQRIVVTHPDFSSGASPNRTQKRCHGRRCTTTSGASGRRLPSSPRTWDRAPRPGWGRGWGPSTATSWTPASPRPRWRPWLTTTPPKRFFWMRARHRSCRPSPA